MMSFATLFVITHTCLFGIWVVDCFLFLMLLASLEREEAEHLIKSHGGRVTGSVSKKTVRIFTFLFF